MGRLTIPTGDYAAFDLPGTTEEVAVKQFIYSNATQAATAIQDYDNDSEPEFGFDLPNGQRRQVTRGEVLFALHNQNCVLLILRRVTGTPLPFWYPY